MLISVEHLSKRQNIKEIVNDVSFAIEDRDKIALIGVNGTGKQLCCVCWQVWKPMRKDLSRKKRIACILSATGPCL